MAVKSERTRNESASERIRFSMNFAFIGTKSEWQLIQPVFQDPSPYRLVAVLVQDRGQTSLPESGANSVQSVDDFDELCAVERVDGVIVGGEQRVERVRRLVQLGRNCLCLHPLDTTPLSYHEIALVARDHGALIMPWLVARLHPACQAVAALCRSGSLGPLKYIKLECTGMLPRSRLLLAGTYAEAIDMLHMLPVEVTELSCAGDSDSGRLVVHHRLAGGGDMEVRLQRNTDARTSWTLAIDGVEGTALLRLEAGLADGGALSHRGRDGSSEDKVDGIEPARAIVDQFSQVIRGGDRTVTWSDAIRAAELADWARYSLERRRAVDIFHEERGELASFKGRMTSLGCGLIWVTLLLLIIIAAGKGLELPGMDLLAVATAAVWLLFLLFQGLRWALPKE